MDSVQLVRVSIFELTVVAAHCNLADGSVVAD